MATDPFAPFAAKLAEAGEPPLVTKAFRSAYERLRAGEQGKVSSAHISPVAVDEVTDVADLGRYRQAGIDALGHAVVVKLNGGLGTSMGLTKAKSLLPAKGDFTFLDIIIKQVLHLRSACNARLPLILMNSFRTREDCANVLKRYPELDCGLPLDFLQHKMPRILASDLTPIEWPANREHEWYPPGHGDIYEALQSSNVLRQLLAAGVRYAFVSNADNLGAVLDPTILGWVASEHVPFVMEVCERTEGDKKGGHVARRRDGRLILREFSQAPDDQINEFQDVKRWHWINTNNLWVDLRSLADVLAANDGLIELPLIVNRKPVDPDDPSSPQVIQLETAMGAGMAAFAGARVVRVRRAERFVPVKTTSELLALWSDAYELAQDYRIVLSPRRGASGAPLVDLDPKYFRQVGDVKMRFRFGPPSLVGARRFVVLGDVFFEGGVVVEGDVRVEQRRVEPLVVKAGTRLVG